MSVYLRDIPLDKAQQLIDATLQTSGLSSMLADEEIALDTNALGRILAEPVWAKISSPHYHASAMDGFAVKSKDTVHAIPSQPVLLSTVDKAQYVDTGDPLPAWANAVIPIEQVEALDENGNLSENPHRPHTIRIRSAVSPWTHVRPMGEDMVATQLVLPSGHQLRPVDLGAIAACGITTIKVSKKPLVAVLPTGDELKPIGQTVAAGDIIEYNSLVLSAQVTSWGAEAHRYPITPDNFDLLCDQVQKAVDLSDLVLINAGSSAGSEDYSARVVETLGDLIFHGVAVRPGHPVIFGIIVRSDGSNKKVPVFGVPGYPVSAALTGDIFIEPIIRRWLGMSESGHDEVTGSLTRKITSPAGDDDFIRVVVGEVDGSMKIAPLTRGAGVISSLVRADGIMVLPRGVQGAEAGTLQKVRLNRKRTDIQKTILAIGSHDMSLDILAQYLARHDRRFVSSNVGSLGGLIALKRKESHLAGTHLLDTETGEYNLSYIAQYLPDTPIQLMVWAEREQGLIVRSGNPLKITGLADLTREDVTYINRQRGSGTRVLLDYELGRAGIPAAGIQGYAEEEYTHLAVAAAVASGRADCGMGITAAARALNLDFIPLFKERYDLAIPCSYLVGELLKPLMDLIHDGEFVSALKRLDGYDFSRLGEIILNCSG